MKSKYWLMNSEIMGCNISQSLSKKISQNFNGIKYECECGKTHGVIHDMVDSLDILYLKCDDCAIVYFDEEQMDKLSEDHITKSNNVCSVSANSSNPNTDNLYNPQKMRVSSIYGEMLNKTKEGGL